MRYHNITKDDMLNGDGLRVVLWVAGCEHHCPNCQNPVTWDINGGLEFDEAAKKEIFDELEKKLCFRYNIQRRRSSSYTKIEKTSGALIEEIKEKFPNKTIWIYSGYDWQEVKRFAVYEIC